MENVININKKYLSFREEAKEIKRKILKTKNKIVYLDFSDVFFISRSFTDELLNVAEELKNMGIIVKFKNIKLDIKKNVRIS